MEGEIITIETAQKLAEYDKLKKQLEEWITHLIEAKKMLDIQAQQGNYDFDEYMLGIYNGMEYIVSIFENREPEYISGTEVKFINNKQKQFIEWLEDEKDRLIKETSHYYIDSFDRQHTVNETIYDEVDMILQKYKETIGDGE